MTWISGHFSRIAAGGCGAVHLGHHQVHQHDVGLELVAELHGLAAVAGFAHQIQVGLDLEDCGQPAADHAVVVDNQDANRGAVHSCLLLHSDRDPGAPARTALDLEMAPMAWARSRMMPNPRRSGGRAPVKAATIVQRS
jgi:hypothetical protein